MEELKVIMEAIKGLGGEAKTAFIVWVVVKYALAYLTTVGGVIGVALVLYKLLSPLIKNMHFISQIKDTMGYYGEYLSNKEKLEVITILQKHKNK